jgi:hypothetical protein
LVFLSFNILGDLYRLQEVLELGETEEKEMNYNLLWRKDLIG